MKNIPNHKRLIPIAMRKKLLRALTLITDAETALLYSNSHYYTEESQNIMKREEQRLTLAYNKVLKTLAVGQKTEVREKPDAE